MTIFVCMSMVNMFVDSKIYKIALVADKGGQGSLLESSGQGICWHRVR